MSNRAQSPILRPQEDHEGLQVVPDDGLQTPNPDEPPIAKDLIFQPYAAGSQYGGPLNVRGTGFEASPGQGSPPPAFHLLNEYKTGRNNTLPMEDAPPTPFVKGKRYGGLRKRTFWLLTLLLLIAIIGLAVGLGVGLSGSKSSTPSSSSSTSTATSSAAPSSSSPIGQTCVNGTGPDNYLGLCSFSCNFGYCPPPCSCSQFSSTAISPPPISNTGGYPLPGENADYAGLCSFTCNHGYCPPGACTTDISGAGNLSSSSSASVSTPSSVSSKLPSSSPPRLTLTAPTSTVVVTLEGSQTSTVVVVQTKA
ncbi:hypothetical protein DSL72_006192 [Monilinia vaccinii-corymbosi]|uniref:Uncharacterized protein n=1 Tax=Monilinia vaccinii-corymbosi TaxID=61207 RepID=A0A8A3PH83_9HELO|nr:hypothetical protein DSL72_006192 [Monilinia vaccinii-corymbosi]